MSSVYTTFEFPGADMDNITVDGINIPGPRHSISVKGKRWRVIKQPHWFIRPHQSINDAMPAGEPSIGVTVLLIEVAQ